MPHRMGSEQILDFQPLLQEIETLDSTALLVFDIDETLIVAKDKILRPCGEKHLTTLSSQLGQKLSLEQQNELRSLTLLQRKIHHTDPLLATVFAKIQERQIPSIALTAMPTGKFGLIPVMEQWREQELKSFGINFASHSPYKNSLSFEEFGYAPPLFYEGMLFSVDHSKGATLKAFLQKTQLRPSKIVFVEDRHPHIEAVGKELLSMSIPYQGFHYIGATCPSEEVNDDIVKLQFQFLLEKKQWLSDEEALKHLNRL